MSGQYTGRQMVMETLVAEGVEHLFGNPGTTELPLIECLPDYPQIQYIVALQEAIAVSMADAYAQSSGRVGVANLHVAPGLGNAIGSLYNAWEGRSPVVVTAGQQDTRYRLREPVLWHDLVAMAAPVTKWSAQAESVGELPELLHRAFKVARDVPAGPVFVALPLNVMIDATDHAPLAPSRIFSRTRPEPAGVEAAVQRILAAAHPVIFCGDQVARTGAVPELVRLAETIGASVHGDILPAQMNFPNQHSHFSVRGAGDYAQIRALTEGADLVLLVAGEFFEEVWYVDEAPFPAQAAVIQIDASARNLGRNHRLDCGLQGDPKLSLQALLEGLESQMDAAYRGAAAARGERLGKRKEGERTVHLARIEKTGGNRPMSSAKAMHEIARGCPDDVLVAREAITADNDLNRSFEFEAAGDYIGSRGGGIGQGLPSALGLKLARPDRPVLCLSGDGSSLYTIQALWTAAHHRIPVVFVILHNRVYRVLKYNMNRYRATAGITGRTDYPHLDLTEPDLDFVALAQGFGMPAERVLDPEGLAAAVSAAFAAGEPYLLDVEVEGGV